MNTAFWLKFLFGIFILGSILALIINVFSRVMEIKVVYLYLYTFFVYLVFMFYVNFFMKIWKERTR
jgi:Ca2+/Na+ antiporter